MRKIKVLFALFIFFGLGVFQTFSLWDSSDSVIYNRGRMYGTYPGSVYFFTNHKFNYFYHTGKETWESHSGLWDPFAQKNVSYHTEASSSSILEFDDIFVSFGQRVFIISKTSQKFHSLGLYYDNSYFFRDGNKLYLSNKSSVVYEFDINSWTEKKYTNDEWLSFTGMNIKDDCHFLEPFITKSDGTKSYGGGFYGYGYMHTSGNFFYVYYNRYKKGLEYFVPIASDVSCKYTYSNAFFPINLSKDIKALKFHNYNSNSFSDTRGGITYSIIFNDNSFGTYHEVKIGDSQKISDDFYLYAYTHKITCDDSIIFSGSENNNCYKSKVYSFAPDTLYLGGGIIVNGWVNLAIYENKEFDFLDVLYFEGNSLYSHRIVDGEIIDNEVIEGENPGDGGSSSGGGENPGGGDSGKDYSGIFGQIAKGLESVGKSIENGFIVIKDTIIGGEHGIKLENIGNNIKTFYEIFETGIEKSIDGLGNLGDFLHDGLMSIVDAILNGLGILGDLLHNGMMSIVNAIIDGLGNLGDFLHNSMIGLTQSLVKGFQTVFQDIFGFSDLSDIPTNEGGGIEIIGDSVTMVDGYIPNNIFYDSKNPKKCLMFDKNGEFLYNVGFNFSLKFNIESLAQGVPVLSQIFRGVDVVLLALAKPVNAFFKFLGAFGYIESGKSYCFLGHVYDINFQKYLKFEGQKLEAFKDVEIRTGEKNYVDYLFLFLYGTIYFLLLYLLLLKPKD